MKQCDKIYINGEWVTPQNADVLDVINPATEQVVGQVALASVADTDQAVVAAADTIKRVALELGGKSADIILEDADFDAAVSNGAAECFRNTGQSCNAPTRMLVPAHLHDRAVEIAKKIAEETRVGDPMQESSNHLFEW